MRLVLPSIAAVLCLLLALPASAGRVRDDLDLLARDFRELQQLFEAERARSAQLESDLAELRRLTGVDVPGRPTAADLSARLDGLDRDVQVIFENQNESKAQIAVLTDKVDALFRHQAVFGGAPAAEGEMVFTTEADPSVADESFSSQLPPAPPVPGGAVEIGEGGERLGDPGPAADPPSVLLDPEELYRAARADYGRGDYSLAIEGFEEFLRRFPASELADNSLYWVGESHWAQRRYESALASFDAVLQQHPGGDKTPDAGLKRGLCLIELNRMADGIIQLQHVKDAYPGSTASRLAREKLESLGLM